MNDPGARRSEAFANAVSRPRLDKASNLGPSRASQEPIKTLLGVSLAEVIEYANVVVSFTDMKYDVWMSG